MVLAMKNSKSEWEGYILKDYDLVRFPHNMLVFHVGCGNGTQLQDLRSRGCLPIGLDLDMISLAECRKSGLPVLQDYAEQLPVKDAAFDGLICKVIIPLTGESRTIRENGRVLRAGAAGYLCYHG